MAKDFVKRSENYSEWYNELVVRADLAENSSVSVYVWYPDAILPVKTTLYTSPSTCSTLGVHVTSCDGASCAYAATLTSTAVSIVKNLFIMSCCII